MIVVFTAMDDTTATLQYYMNNLLENFIVPAVYEVKTIPTTTKTTAFSENFIIVLSMTVFVIISKRRKK